MAMARTFTIEYFKRMGAKGGKLSASARMKKLTSKQRSDIAKKAAAASAKARSAKAKSKEAKRNASK
jgi:hypothetical protein